MLAHCVGVDIGCCLNSKTIVVKVISHKRKFFVKLWLLNALFGLQSEGSRLGVGTSSSTVPWRSESLKAGAELLCNVGFAKSKLPDLFHSD